MPWSRNLGDTCPSAPKTTLRIAVATSLSVRDFNIFCSRSSIRSGFLNGRVDEVISFNKLTEENFRAIAGIMLTELRQALSERGIDFTWDESVIDALVKKSYSVTYGARNLRRTIQKDLEDPIAQKIIESFVNPLHTLHASADADGAFTVTGA